MNVEATSRQHAGNKRIGKSVGETLWAVPASFEKGRALSPDATTPVPPLDSPSSASAPTSPIAPTSPTSPWLDVAAVGDNRYRVRLGGLFGPTWLASLCTELSDNDLSIERAHATRAPDASWLAELTLEADEGAEDPCSLPYLEWADSELEAHAAYVRPTTFDLETSDAHGGTLCLTLEADDVLGLLGTLLTQLAHLCLCAVELHVETRAGRAHDRVWLATADGCAPSEAHREELESLLRRRV